MASEPTDTHPTWDCQTHWHAILDHFGENPSECPKAKAYLAARLREAADVVEAKGWPDVYGCDVPMPGDTLLGRGHFIGEISVVLSHPWPG